MGKEMNYLDKQINQVHRFGHCFVKPWEKEWIFCLVVDLVYFWYSFSMNVHMYALTLQLQSFSTSPRLYCECNPP